MSRTAVAAVVASIVFGGAAAARDLSPDERLAILVAAYPETLSHVADGALHFRDGGPPIAIDDGRAKDHQQALADADIEDMLRQVYPVGPCAYPPAQNFDPGRIRNEALMKRLYGSSRDTVAAQTTRIDWFGTRLQVTTAHGAAAALEAVRDEIAALPEDVRRPAMKSAGTFNWRPIANTTLLSVHSFAAAIDLDTDYANYWVWAGGKPGDAPGWANRFPTEIIAIFERHGFIWGGRWYHYDTMHFEYRPEMIAIGRAAGADACAQP